jgi:hypothetical protein
MTLSSWFGIQLVLHYVVGKKQQSCWRVLWVPKGHEWACWKGRKPTAWHLMPHNKHLGKQGCRCQFRNHKRFNPHRSVSICPSVLVVSNRIVLHCYLLPVCYSLFICCYSSSCQLFRFTFIHSARSCHIHFCFCFVCSVSFDYSLFAYSVFFSVLILEIYSTYFDPHVNNHPASQ